MPLAEQAELLARGLIQPYSGRPVAKRGAGQKSPTAPPAPFAPVAPETRPACRYLGDPISHGDARRICLYDGADREWDNCVVTCGCAKARRRYGDETRVCAECPQQLPPWPFPAHRRMSPAEFREYLDRGAEWPADWVHWPVTRETLAAMRRDAVASPPAPPPLAGDGVVTVGGGDYDASLYVSLSMLRDTGCDLPVRVYHRGEAEPVSDAIRSIPGVEVIDLTPHRGDARRWGGWEVKILAVMRCGWRRVLFLDADAYPVIDPSPWLDAVADPAPPVVIWPDGEFGQGTGRFRPGSYGISDADAARVPPINGGHYLFDVPRAWPALALHRHFDQYSDYYYAYKSGVGGYGDQDQMRAAIILTGVPFTLAAPKLLRLDRGTWLQAAPDGVTPGIVHRVRTKFGRVNRNGKTPWGYPITRTDRAPGEPAAHRHFAAWCEATRSSVPRPLWPTESDPGPPAGWVDRGNGWDTWHWGEVVRDDCYGLRGIDASGWRVLDIGANIGTFAYAATAAGAAEVHSYEPEAGNYFTLERNAAQLPGVTPYRAAVTAASGWVRVTPDPRNLTNVGAYRVVPGGNVPAVGINDAIRRLGYVDLLKIDAEGSEYDIIPAADLSNVARVVLEYHAGGDPAALAAVLTAAGFDVTPYTVPPSGQGLLFAARRQVTFDCPPPASG